MLNQNLIHFLFFLVILLSYFLYEESEENQRLYQIAVDSEQSIEDLKKAIQAQQNYTKQLEIYYYDLYNKV